MNGYIEGEGEIKYENGDKYNGNFKNGKNEEKAFLILEIKMYMKENF